ncbi:hypothetical protein [Mycobacteroides abscessus]|uniref:hypothetical protein n=1 Tax=Mycobacteroides abscessus TaxID=36809 RepID=UPI0009413184|nr:hypothetical protein [Mycobacteroides abscessus]
MPGFTDDEFIEQYESFTATAREAVFPHLYLPNYITLLKWYDIAGDPQAKRSGAQSESLLQSAACWLRDTIGYIPLMWHLLCWFEFGNHEFREIFKGVIKPTKTPSVGSCRSGSWDVVHIARLTLTRKERPAKSHVLVTADAKFAALADTIAGDHDMYRIPVEYIAEDRAESAYNTTRWYEKYLKDNPPTHADPAKIHAVVRELESSLDFGKRQAPYREDTPEHVIPAYLPHIERILTIAGTPSRDTRFQDIVELRFDAYINAVKIALVWLGTRHASHEISRSDILELLCNDNDREKMFDSSPERGALEYAIAAILSHTGEQYKPVLSDLYTHDPFVLFHRRRLQFMQSFFWLIAIIRSLAIDEAQRKGTTVDEIISQARQHFHDLVESGHLG